MLDAPEIVQTDAQPVARIRLTVPRSEIRNVMGPGLEEVHSVVAQQGVAVAGPWFTHHLRMDPSVFDLEICVPVTAPVTAAGRVEPGELPAARVARTVYHGPFEGLPAAWGAFDAWIAAHGHAPAGNLIERYVAGPESGPDAAAWQTELCRPLMG
jgi:effector-binding domain-containing protein